MGDYEEFEQCTANCKIDQSLHLINNKYILYIYIYIYSCGIR